MYDGISDDESGAATQNNKSFNKLFIAIAQQAMKHCKTTYTRAKINNNIHVNIIISFDETSHGLHF